MSANSHQFHFQQRSLKLRQQPFLVLEVVISGQNGQNGELVWMAGMEGKSIAFQLLMEGGERQVYVGNQCGKELIVVGTLYNIEETGISCK